MGEQVDLTVIRNKKKEEARCLYCGEPPHKTILACPRIALVHIDDEGDLVGIEFHEGWEPKKEDKEE